MFDLIKKRRFIIADKILFHIKVGIVMAFLFIVRLDQMVAQTQIFSTGDGSFETGLTFPTNGWNVVNGANNKWYIGNPPIPSSGSSCVFTGTNQTTWLGTSNSSVNHFYRDVTFPYGATNIQLSFKYKLINPDAGYDFLKVFLLPTTTTPNAGTQLSSGLNIGASGGYDTPTSWTTVNISGLDVNAGTTKRLVFSWENDGAYPAAIAIDDILLTCTVPPPCSATPLGGTATATTNTGCPGYYCVLSVTGASIQSGLLFQWQYSLTGGDPWNPVTNATNALYAASFDSSCYYRRVVTCFNSGESSVSSVVYLSNTGSVNDNCSNAIPINPDNVCLGASVVNGSLMCSTNSGIADPVGTADDDVWFSFVAEANTQYVTLDNLGGADFVTEVFSGSCGSLVSIDYFDSDPENEILTGLIVGQTYYIRVYSYGTAVVTNGTFNLCVKNPLPLPPPCGTNPPASDFCSSATQICNLNGYCGNTSSSYTEDNEQLEASVFCGYIENNSWLKFIASNDTAVLNVYVSNCQNDWGIQMQIFSTNDCNTFVSHSNCWNPGVMENGTVMATGLVVGQMYYLMIDGQSGDVCDYIISASTGVLTPEVSVNSDTICLGQSTQLFATGGISYQWSPSIGLSNPNIANPIASPISTTVYTVSVTGGNPGCEATATASTTVVVKSPSQSTIIGDSTVCIDSQNNVYSTEIGMANYSWSVSSGGVITSDTVSNSITVTWNQVGNQLVSVSYTNSGECTQGTTFYNVLVDQKPTAVIIGDSIICNGESVNLCARGGSVYNWNNGMNDSCIVLSPTENSLYVVTVTSMYGCTSSYTKEIQVNQNPQIVDYTIQQAKCLKSTGSISVHAINGQSPFTYLWNSGGNDSIIENLNIGTYFVTVTDNNGCSVAGSASMTSTPVPELNLVSTNNDHCNQGIGGATVLVDNMNSVYSYIWQTSPPRFGETISGLTAGTYMVIASDEVCTDTLLVNIANEIGPTADFYVTPQQTSLSNSLIHFVNESVGAVSYFWDFGDGENSAMSNPLHNYASSNTFDVILEVVDAYGCVDTMLKTVTIYDDITIYIPNAFTSDNDGLNEVFRPFGKGYLEEGYSMKIFDRWGKLIFFSNAFDKGWDGLIDGKAADINSVFVYRIRLFDFSKKIHEYIGHVTILGAK